MAEVINKEAGALTEEYMASYSRYVAQSRSVPSLVDGLKPVQRRILNSADDLHLYHDKRFLKSAKLEGQILGDYHPHGGASLSGLVQPFKIRYPLLEGQGNWGCPDDPSSVAASRYTEVRLTKFAEDFYLSSSDYADRDANYDGRLQEVVQYYPPIPGVLLTGAEGIAIGLTTKIPVHEVGVVCKSLLKYIDNPDSQEYLECMVPDTCEGSILTSPKEDIIKLYTKGEATLTYRAKTHYERDGRNHKLVVDAFPPGFSRKKLQSSNILEYVENGQLELSNESSTGIRYVFTVSDKDISILDEVKDLLTSSVSYKMHIENKGVVGLYDLKSIYSQFLESRKEYIIKKYSDLSAKNLHEAKYILAFQTLQMDKELIHKIIDSSEEEAMSLIKGMHSDPDMVPDDIARRILNTPIRQLTADNNERMGRKLDTLEEEIKEYESYVKDPLKRIRKDIEELSLSYSSEMNSEVEYLKDSVSEEDPVGYVIEDNEIVLGRNPKAVQFAKYFILYDHEGFVVVEGDYFREKDAPLILNTDHLLGILGINDLHNVTIVYDDAKIPLDTWGLRKRVSKVICKESKSKNLVEISISD